MEDLTGMKFNDLTVIGFSHISKANYYWKCICECGKNLLVQRGSLKNGHAKSCGCVNRKRLKERFAKENTKHNLSRTPTYKIWQGMIQRCKNINRPHYKNYGGRGIEVCEEWLNFENFYKDMGERPNGLSLDRVDNNGNYCKENCKWSTSKEQRNNTRTNVNITYKNKTQSLSEWSVELGIKRGTLRNRLDRYKWTVSKTFETKVGGK